MARVGKGTAPERGMSMNTFDSQLRGVLEDSSSPRASGLKKKKIAYRNHLRHASVWCPAERRDTQNTRWKDRMETCESLVW